MINFKPKLVRRSTSYTGAWHESVQDISYVAAQEIVPVVLSIIHPKSVIDLGCGTGAWLSVFCSHGVTDIVGVDGDYLDRNLLLIDESCFIAHDLTLLFKINREFDLAISLETAEHIPEEYSDVFIDSLVELAPLILFSAAPPYQGGNNHVNEQWPDYWVEKFEGRGYSVIDCLRRRIWKKESIYFCYRQNILMFARDVDLHFFPKLEVEHQYTFKEQLSLIHPSNPCVRKRNLYWVLSKILEKCRDIITS